MKLIGLILLFAMFFGLFQLGFYFGGAIMGIGAIVVGIVVVLVGAVSVNLLMRK